MTVVAARWHRIWGSRDGRRIGSTAIAGFLIVQGSRLVRGVAGGTPASTRVGSLVQDRKADAMIQILRDAGLSELVRSGEVGCLARGFQFTEGPLWCPDSSLLFQDNKAEKTYRLGPDRSVQLLRERTGAANGQTF